MKKDVMAGADHVNRAPALDFGRFIAAVAVYCFHWLYLDPLAERVPWTSVLAPLASYGYLGVEYFFILSGFVICCSAAGGSRLQFMRNRISRLLPAFFVCASLTSIMLAAGGDPVSVNRFLANMTFQARAFGFDYIDPVYWSLAAETLFYGAVFFFAIGKNLRRNLRVSIVIWALLSVLPIRGAPYVLLNLQWAAYFSVGIAWFLWLSERRSIDLVLYFLAVTLAAFTAHASAAKVGAQLVYQPSAVVSSILVFMLCISLPLLASIRLNASAGKLMFWLGALSYPLYLLYYEFIRPILTYAWGHGTTSVVAANVFLLAACYVVCRVEAPLRRLLRGGQDGSERLHRPGLA